MTISGISGYGICGTIFQFSTANAINCNLSCLNNMSSVHSTVGQILPFNTSCDVS